MKPVMYLDIDDTLIDWSAGHGAPAAGAAEFLEWATRQFEVRWLTFWCPDGELPAERTEHLAALLGVAPELLAGIRGLDWDGCAWAGDFERGKPGGKLNGIAWLEHVVFGRPFVWVEDENCFGTFEQDTLDAHGFLDCYRHVDVSRDPGALERLHRELDAWWRRSA